MMETALRTVLLPVDDSEQSRKVFEWYCTHLYHEGDIVIFLNLYVLPKMYNVHTPWPAVKELCEDWNYREYILGKQAEDLLQNYEKRCKENSFSCKSHKIPLSFEDAERVGEKICEFSKEHKADMIVISHCGGKVESKELGSACRYCVNNANIPVCVLFLP